MGGTTLTQEQIGRVVEFHGHWCPGLAIGIRAGELALREFGRAGDEEIVAVVETDMCGVDAIQVLTGCTFGMDADLADAFRVQPVTGPMPRRAPLMQSLTCQACGEKTMESRTRRFNGQALCAPCFESLESRL